jgi:hypothetical protein
VSSVALVNGPGGVLVRVQRLCGDCYSNHRTPGGARHSAPLVFSKVERRRAGHSRGPPFMVKGGFFPGEQAEEKETS